MKKILLASCLCFAAHVSFAVVDSLGINEHRLSRPPYVRFGLGYGFKLSPDIATSSFSARYSGTPYEVNKYKQESYSFGQGVAGVAALGYYLGKNLAMEVAISQGFSGSLPVARNSSDTSNYVKRIKATPATTMQVNMLIHTSGSKVQAYARAGILTSFTKKVTSTLEGAPRIGVDARQTMEMQYKPAFGFSGAFGVRTEVSRNVHLWIEAGAVMLAPYLAQSKIKELEVNGTNIASYLTADELTQHFGFSGTTDNAGGGVTPTSSDAFSNASINAGITFDMEQHRSERAVQNKKGFFFSAAVGYMLPLATKTRDIDGGSSATYALGASRAEQVKFSDNPASYGVGAIARVGAGYMLGPHLGVECDAWMGLGSKEYKYATERYVKGKYGTILESKDLATTRAKSPLLIIPAVVLSTGPSRTSGHIRAGLVLPVNTVLEVRNEEYLLTMSGVTVHGTSEATLRTSFTIGASLSAGASFSVSSHMKIVAELNSISYAPAAREITLTEMTQSGVSVLDQVPVSRRTITYERSGSYGPGTTGNSIMPSYTLPFSGIGLTIGANVSL